MNGQAAAAPHLAELNAAYEVHLVALRARVASARAALANHDVVAGTASRAPDRSYTQYASPPRNPYAEHALIPDTPLVASDEGPAWHD